MRRRNEQDFRHRGRLAHPVVPRELVGDVELAVGRAMVGAVELAEQRIGPSVAFRLPDAPYAQLKDALVDFYGAWVSVNPPRMRVLHNPEDQSLRLLPVDLQELVAETAGALVMHAVSVGEDVLGPEIKAEVTPDMSERVYWSAVSLYSAWVHENPEAAPVLHNPVGRLKRRLTRVPQRGEAPRRNPEGGRTQVLSFGGGVDSMCMLLDAMQRGELPDVVVFIDVGDPEHEDPAEWPETYTYIEEVVKPLLESIGVEFVWITSKMYPVRDARSLYEWFKERGQVPLSGPDHLCSVVAKVERFEKWMNDYFEPGQKVDVWIGFAKGEEARSQRDPHGKKEKKPKRKKGESKAAYEKRLEAKVKRYNRFPLQERGLDRDDCKALIARAGYRVPRKSACVFCPYGKRAEWEDFAGKLPSQFEKIMALEREKDVTTKGYKIYIHQFKKFGLTSAQYRVMRAILEGEREFKRGDKATLRGLQKRSWVSPSGELTSYGETILAEAGPDWSPPISEKTDKPMKADTGVVERAALGGCVRWRQLKKEGERRCAEYARKPILGIHYTGTPVEAYSGYEEGDVCSLTTEEDALGDALAGSIVPVSRLRVRPGEQARLFNPELGALKRRLTNFCC